MSCDYCEKSKTIEASESFSPYGKVYESHATYVIEGNNLSVFYNAYSGDSSFDEYIKINYCPFCGKKLN